jgi:hypothetical protein
MNKRQAGLPAYADAREVILASVRNYVRKTWRRYKSVGREEWGARVLAASLFKEL